MWAENLEDLRLEDPQRDWWHCWAVPLLAPAVRIRGLAPFSERSARRAAIPSVRSNARFHGSGTVGRALLVPRPAKDLRRTGHRGRSDAAIACRTATEGDALHTSFPNEAWRGAILSPNPQSCIGARRMGRGKECAPLTPALSPRGRGCKEGAGEGRWAGPTWGCAPGYLRTPRWGSGKQRKNACRHPTDFPCRKQTFPISILPNPVQDL